MNNEMTTLIENIKADYSTGPHGVLMPEVWTL